MTRDEAIKRLDWYFDYDDDSDSEDKTKEAYGILRNIAIKYEEGEAKMNNNNELLDAVTKAKWYIDKASEALKELNGLETKNTPNTCYAKWNTREHLIFGEDYKLENYGSHGSLTRHFKDMPISTAEILIKLGFLDPEETQNESPTVREFIDFAKNHLDADFNFHGYVVGPEREDCRVSFEGIESNNDEISKETLLDFVKMFLVEYPADDTDVSDERLYCWYD